MTVETSTMMWQTTDLVAMGSRGEILSADADPGVVQWALDELERLEQCWSRFRPSSELSQINAAAGQWVEMSPTMSHIVGLAADIHERTGHLFDPTIGKVLADWGYDGPFAELNRDQTGPIPAPRLTGMASVELRGSQIRLQPGIELDLGGLGKGLAADLVAEGLIERGASGVLVSLGGDMRAIGATPSPQGWDIPIESPLDEQLIGTVQLSNKAIVMSTTRFRNWRRNGKEVHHIIDPRTAAPATGSVAAVVATASAAAIAEGFAKAALIAGRDAGRRLMESSGIDGWLINDDATMSATSWAASIGPLPRSTS